MKTHKSFSKHFKFNWLFICILFLYSTTFKSFSQNNSIIIELKNQLKTTNNDSIKVELLIKLSGIYASANTDTSMQYAKKALRLAEIKNNKNLIARCYHSIGVTYYYKSDYNEALEYYFKALKISEELNIQKQIGSVCNNIGTVYWMQENLDGALEFYFRDLKIAKELGDEVSAAKTLGNIGLIYDFKGETDKALEYFYKGIDLSEKLGDKTAVTNAYINIGVIFQDKKEHVEAIKYFLKAYDIAINESNKDALALVYINAGSSYVNLNEYDKAEDFLLKSVEISKAIGSKNYLRYSYKYLSTLYYKLQNYKTSLEYFSQSVLVKDSIYNEEKSKQMAEMQTQFETEKKQKQIEIQKLKLNQQDLEINKKQLVIYGTTAGFVIMILLALIIFRSYRQKKKSNEIILSQNKSLEQANEEISAQRDEIEGQRDTLNSQNKKLEIVNTKITDSINYAKYIQQAVIPSDSVLDNMLSDYFILFKPKDIVSGDFYWANRINDNLIIAVADCTGHGVPGAFMSMLGISFLNEIVRKKEVNQANQVLNLLRISVIEALCQTGRNEEQKDGMDMSLIVIKSQAPSSKLQEEESEQYSVIGEQSANNEPQTTNYKLQTTNLLNAQWAGANNPLWIVRSRQPLIANNQSSIDNLIELKPDKMPIAIYDNMQEFTNHEFQLQTGDIIYLMTDGYEDTMGGPKGKKFMSKKLKELIIANCLLTMEEQKQLLEKTLVDWIGNEEQLDDITLMGIKL